MKIIGHRGAKGLAPENTIASVKQALKYKVDELEFDLRVTQDGIVILNHHRYMIDDNRRLRIVANNSYAELLADKPDLATFDEVLKLVNRKVHLYVEIKPGEPIEPVVAIITKCLENGWETSDFSIGSYSQKILRGVKQTMPSIELIVIEHWSGIRATYRARQLGTKRISMSQRWLWSGFIKMMARRNWQLAAFTINDPAKAARWEQYGLHAVVTDYPDRFNK